MANLDAKNTKLLAAAVEGRNSQQGFVYGEKGAYKALADAQLVEFNDAQKQGKQVAVRATDAGIAAFTASQGGGTATQQPAGTVETTTDKTVFAIEKNIALPAAHRRVGDGASKYPFDSLEIGDSFHVAPSTDMPKPAKSMASSVTAANMRFANKVPGQHKTRKGTMVDNFVLTKKFVIRPVDASDPKGVGARIWRVDLGSKGAAEATETVGQ